MKRFDDFARELFHKKCIETNRLVEIPGTDIYEYLFEYCDHATAMNNHSMVTEWASAFGDKYPKFILVAYSMVLFKTFDMLKKMIYGRYHEYEEVLSGLWLHYIGFPHKPSQQTISSNSQ